MSGVFLPEIALPIDGEHPYWLAIHAGGVVEINENKGEGWKVSKAIFAADVREVVTCGACQWWTKAEASCQGRCELMGLYPTSAWFCGNGRRAGG